MLDGPESKSEFARLFDPAAGKQPKPQPESRAPKAKRNEDEPANWVLRILELILDFFI